MEPLESNNSAPEGLAFVSCQLQDRMKNAFSISLTQSMLSKLYKQHCIYVHVTIHVRHMYMFLGAHAYVGELYAPVEATGVLQVFFFITLHWRQFSH